MSPSFFNKLVGGKYRPSPVSYSDPLPVDTYGVETGLTKSSVAGTGASATLLAADASRKLVIVSNSEANGTFVIDPTGGSALTGITLAPGGQMILSGVIARSAMTQYGPSGQNLTVYVGT